MKALRPDIARQLEIIKRGVVEIFPEEELIEKLERSIAENKPLRVKQGFDPSAPDVHLGHTVGLRKLRQFQDLGHTAVVIIGDYTAMVGDPSGRSKTRPQLSHQQTMENAATYIRQFMKVLSKENLEIVYNGEWFSKMDLAGVIRLASKMTVARMLERDDFSVRFKDGIPIAVSEFLYPLMQGYDSVEVKADVELGATEQKFNLLVGRALQTDAAMETQVCLTMPVLPGTDGVRRMGKSLGNYIGIDEPPNEMYGKVMSIPDDIMRQYFELVSDVPMDDVERLLAAHPRDAKAALAARLVEMYHGAEAAKGAAAEFDRVFRKGKLPGTIPSVRLPESVFQDGRVGVIDLLSAARLVSSKSEARRMVQQGAVTVAGDKVTDIEAVLAVEDGTVIQVGKRKFAAVELP